MVKLARFLKPYRDAGAWNSVIPIRRFLDGGVFMTKSNQIGVVIEAGGIDDECLAESVIASCTKRAENAWRAFDEQFELHQFLLKQDAAGDLFSLRLVYVILLDPPRYAGNALSTARLLDALTAQLDQSRRTLLAKAKDFLRNMNDLLGLRILDKDEAFGFFRLLVNLDPGMASDQHLLYDSNVDYFLPSLPICNTAAGLKIGDADVEVLSLREPPNTLPNVLRDLLRVRASFIVAHQFKRVPNSVAIATIRKAQSGWRAAATAADVWSLAVQALARFGLFDRSDVIEDKSALVEVDDLHEITKRINNGGEYLGDFAFTVVVYGWDDRARMKRAATEVIQTFANCEGSLVAESWNALTAYLSILPGNRVFTEPRRKWLLSGNYADLSLLWKPSAGDARNRHLNAEHLVTLETNDATPFCFNLHEADVLGALIFGAPGSGKSVTANLFIDKSQKYSPRTFILDIGGNYRKLTQTYGGSYLSFGAASGFRINPFCLAGSPDDLQFLWSFLRMLLNGSGARLSATDDSELFDAIESIYVLQPDDRTLSTLALGLPPALKPYLHPWTRAGQYGAFFDNREDTLTFSEFQTFDFQGMESYQQVLEPLLFYVFHRISQVVYDPTLRSVPKQLFADEVWRFLMNDTARTYLLSAGKTWRKHNGGIVLITQSLDDLRNAGVLNLVNEVCPTKILLASPGADLASYADVFKLNEKELTLYSGLTPKRQFLLKTDTRSKVLNVELDPRTLAEYSTSPQVPQTPVASRH